MARQFDLFYAAQDRSYLGQTSPITSNGQATLDGAQRLEAYPTELTLTNSTFLNVAQIPEGTYGKLTDASTGTVAHVEFLRDATTTSAWVRPINSGADTVDTSTFTASSRSFATGSTLTQQGVYQDAAVCVIDLREAPQDSRGYTYALLGAGWVNFENFWSSVNTVAAQTTVKVRMVGPTPPDDPFSGDEYMPQSTVFGDTDVTRDVGNSTATAGLYDGGYCHGFNVGGIVDLEPGGLYTFRVQFACAHNVACRVQAHDAKLLAVRFDRNADDTRILRLYDGAGTLTDTEGDGKTENAMTNATSVIKYYLGSASNPAAATGSRIVALGMIAQASAIDYAEADESVRVVFRQPGGGDGESRYTPISTASTESVASLTNDPASGELSARFETNTPDLGTTVTLRYGWGVIATPLFITESENDATTTSAAAATTGDADWVEMASDSGDRDADAYYLETFTSSFGDSASTWTDYAYGRLITPNTAVEGYAADINNVGRFSSNNYPDLAVTGNADAMRRQFQLLRSRYSAAISGTAKMALEGQTPRDSGGATVRANRVNFGTMRERSALTIPEGSALTVVCRVDTGLVLRSGWTVGTSYGDGSYDYGFALSLTDATNAPGGPEQILGGVTALYRNGTKLTATTKVLYDAGTFELLEWYFDRSARTLHLRMGGSSDNSSEPWDDDITLVATVPLYLGRTAANLLDESGVRIPYEPRLAEVPGASTEIDSSGGVVTSGASLGSLSVINADGAFDDLVVRRIFEGRRAELLVGYESVSDDIADFVTYQSGTQAVPSSNFQTLDIKLLDGGVLLDRRLAGTKHSTNTVTAYTGDPADPTEVEGQSVPVIYGQAKRVPAYRITNNTGSGDSNEYQFSSSVCHIAYHAHMAPDDREAVAMTVTNGEANAADGKVSITNVVLAASAYRTGYDHASNYSSSLIPDVVYVDCWGQEHASGNRPLVYPGEILEHILTNPGEAGTGLAADQIDAGSLDLLDRRWRQQMATVYDDPQAGTPTTTVGNRFLGRLAPFAGGVFYDGTTLRDAAQTIASSVFAYLTQNRGGRQGVGVADYRTDNLVRNGSVDNDNPQIGGAADTASDYLIYPWRLLNDAVGYRTAAEGTRYLGQFGLALDNGAASAGVNYRAAVEQAVDVSQAGRYVVTLLAKLDATSTSPATNTKFRIALVLPDGAELLGGAHSISAAGAFERVTEVFEVPFGGAGRGKVRIYPYYADDDTDATNRKYVWLDVVEAYRVLTTLDESNTSLESWEFGFEIYDSVAASFDVTEGNANRHRIRATNNEAVGLYVTENEVRDAQPSAGALSMDYNLSNAPSAAGVAAVAASYYAHQRLRVKLTAYGLAPMRTVTSEENELEFRMPVVGDRVYVPSVGRLPVGFDASPLWRIDAVSFRGGTAQEVQLTISQPVDVFNRTRAGSWS